LIGPGAVLLDKLSQWRPALILFDLNNNEIPWREWVALIKAVTATRRIPVVCFGSHMDVGTMQTAKKAGSDATLARSQFVADLPQIIQKYARLPDYAALESACQERLSELAIKGLEEFNHGEYFEAHESLEEAWNEDETSGRELYRAILQVAVAYLQIERGNYRGALKMFLRVRQWIEPLPDLCRGVDIERLRQDAAKVYAALQVLGPNRVNEFDRRLFQPVQYRREA
jgi:predicted metal-dependent hydrolase